MTTLIRWIARVMSVLVLIFLLAFLIGEGFMGDDPLVMPTVQEWVSLLFFPIGLLIGLGVGWWHELWGGLIGVGAILLFYLIDILFTGTPPSGFWFILLTVPAMLFLILGLINRTRSNKVDTERLTLGKRST